MKLATCEDCVWSDEDEHEVLWCTHPERQTFTNPNEGDDATSCQGFNKGHCLSAPECPGFNDFQGIPPMP